MSDVKGFTKADYEAFLEKAITNGWGATYNAAAEDGYDPTINWGELCKPKPVISPNLEILITEIERKACSCESFYSCDAHQKIDALRQEFISELTAAGAKL